MRNDAFDEFRSVLKQELTQILSALSTDKDNYGFALAVPSDYGSAALFYAVGKESKLREEGKNHFAYRYSPVEWMPTWLWPSDSNEALGKVVESFTAQYRTVDDPERKNQMHDDFISDCASACLDVLQECNDAGLFGNVWYKVLEMSDEEHPVVAQAFRSLNSGRALEEASPLFDY